MSRAEQLTSERHTAHDRARTPLTRWSTRWTTHERAGPQQRPGRRRGARARIRLTLTHQRASRSSRIARAPDVAAVRARAEADDDDDSTAERATTMRSAAERRPTRRRSGGRRGGGARPRGGRRGGGAEASEAEERRPTRRRSAVDRRPTRRRSGGRRGGGAEADEAEERGRVAADRDRALRATGCGHMDHAAHGSEGSASGASAFLSCGRAIGLRAEARGGARIGYAPRRLKRCCRARCGSDHRPGAVARSSVLCDSAGVGVHRVGAAEVRLWTRVRVGSVLMRARTRAGVLNGYHAHAPSRSCRAGPTVRPAFSPSVFVPGVQV